MLSVKTNENIICKIIKKFFRKMLTFRKKGVNIYFVNGNGPVAQLDRATPF